MKRIVCFFFMLFALNGGLAYAEEADFSPIKGLKLIPVIDLKYQYNDNILFSEANKKSSSVTIIKSGASIQEEGDSASYSLSYGLSKGVVYNSKADNYLDHLVELKADLRLTKRLNAKMSISYARSHDARGVTVTGFATLPSVLDKWNQSRAKLIVGYGVHGRVEFTGEVDRQRYSTNRNRTKRNDLDTIGAGLLLSYPVGVKTDAAVEVHYRKNDYKFNAALNSRDSVSEEYLFGLNWDATENTHGSAKVGYLRRVFSNDSSSVSNNFNWDVNMSWSPYASSNFVLKSFSMIDETDGLGSFVKVKDTSIIWKYEWSSFFSHSVNINYILNKYGGLGVVRSDKMLDVNVALEYQLVRWLALSGGYQYFNRSSNAVNGSYRQNVFSIGLLGLL